MIDGSGTQSLAAAVQAGGHRSVAVVLLKEGFGVKDAYVVPCDSATEQRGLVARITDAIDARDVPADYMAAAIAVALGDGLERGQVPAPGLVDVVQTNGFDDLCSLPCDLPAIVALADPAGALAGLSVQARGRLITASGHWPEKLTILDRWFEDSDDLVTGIEAASSPKPCAARCGRFSSIAAATGPGVSRAPAICSPHRPSGGAAMRRCRAGTGRRTGPEEDTDNATGVRPVDHCLDGRTGLASQAAPALPTAGEDAALGSAPAAGELSLPWLDGYLTAAMLAPRFIAPPNWLQPLFHILGDGIPSEGSARDLLNLVMARYIEIAETGSAANPNDIGALPVWCDGFLSAWEADRVSWLACAVGKRGNAVRRALVAAIEGCIDASVFRGTLPDWLRACRAVQT